MRRAFSTGSARQFHSNGKDFRCRVTILQRNNADSDALQSS
jgi:hypothetical protein